MATVRMSDKTKAYITKQMIIAAENQSNEEVLELIEKKKHYREILLQQIKENQNRKISQIGYTRKSSKSPPKELDISGDGSGILKPYRRFRKAVRPPGSAVDSRARIFPGAARETRGKEVSFDEGYIRNRSKSPNNEDLEIQVNNGQINVETQTDTSVTKLVVPIYKQTQEFLRHQKSLPPFPMSYSSHPINEMHMQVQCKLA